MSISGFATAAKIGGMTPVLVSGVQEISVEEESPNLSGTTAEDEGYENDDDGIISCVVTMQLVLDINAGSFIAIRRGTLITDLKIYADVAASTPLYHFPLSKVFRSTYRGQIEGRATYDCVIRSKGPFTVAEPN
jgi:hypothetical protein